jgi:non-heme Fe2+,alpha-ketoglutarate-dependent halogenase
MGKLLTDPQIERYRREGYLSPLRAIDAARASYYFSCLEQSEGAFGQYNRHYLASKAHLVFTWAAELVRNPVVLDAVEDLIGPDILLFNLTIWSKRAHDETYVNWHQDGPYFGLDPCEQITAWVALTPSTPEAGCVEVLPGSHLRGPMRHEERPDEKSLLSRGQYVSEAFDETTTVGMPLAPGEFSLHDVNLLHRSGPNRADHRRVGFGISYVPARVRCTSSVRLTATCVRGTDRYNHFDPEPVPAADYHPEAVEFHKQTLARYVAARNEMAKRHAARAEQPGQGA